MMWGKRKWLTFIYSRCSPCLVGVIRTARCIPFAPIISAINGSPARFQQGYKYFPWTPYGLHIISQTQLNDGKKYNVFLPRTPPSMHTHTHTHTHTHNSLCFTFSQQHGKKKERKGKWHPACVSLRHIWFTTAICSEASGTTYKGVNGNDRWARLHHPLAQFLVDCTRVTPAASANPLKRDAEKKRDTLSEFIINGSISYV